MIVNLSNDDDFLLDLQKDYIDIISKRVFVSFEWQSLFVRLSSQKRIIIILHRDMFHLRL